MMKSVILITFSVLTVVKFVIARHLLEADTEENIDQNLKQRSAEGSIQQSVEEIKPENTTIFNLNIQVEEVIATGQRLPNTVKIEKSGDDSSAKNDSEITESNEEQEQQYGNARVGIEEIADTDIKPSTQPAEEEDKHAPIDPVDESSKEYAQESFEIGGHRHRSDPDNDKDVQHIIFALEPIEMESVQRSEGSSISNEDKIGASRHGRPEIFLGGKRVHPELLKKKLQAAKALDVLSKIGSSRSFSSDLVPSHTKLFNTPMHHPSSHDPSGMHHSPSSHDNTGIYYKDNVLRNPNSKERIGREYVLDAEANSYPYTSSTSNNRSENPVESRSIHSATHTLPSRQVPAFLNLFDYNYSPVMNPIFGAGRLKRNTSTAIVDRPVLRFQVPIKTF